MINLLATRVSKTFPSKLLSSQLGLLSFSELFHTHFVSFNEVSVSQFFSSTLKSLLNGHLSLQSIKYCSQFGVIHKLNEGVFHLVILALNETH